MSYRAIAALLLFGAAASAQEISRAEWLHFDGVRVMPEEVYRAVLRLDAEAGPDAATAEDIERQLLNFLRGSGYELADVDVHVEGDKLHVVIDEGQLERVVFIGRQNLQTIRFKLALDIPHDVFNRPLIERQVETLRKQLGLGEMKLVLAAVSTVQHMGPQLTDVPEVKGFELLHEMRKFELQIVLPDRDWDTGVGLDVRLGGINGLEVLGNYQGRRGLFQDDRWRVNGGFAIALRNVPTEVHFSRAGLVGEYFFPRLLGQLRPTVEASGELVSRIRLDVHLVDYYASEASGAVWIEWEPKKGIRMQVGGGVFDRRIFWLLPQYRPTLMQLSPGVYGEGGTRGYLAARVDFTFDPENERWDRHHRLFVQLQQHLPGIGVGPFAWLRAWYQQVVPFGWHDLWIRGNGYACWYDSSFHDEAWLGEFLHGAFPADYVRRVASFSNEFRFSITRDVLKVSLQSIAAAYTAINAPRPNGMPRDDRDGGEVRFAFAGGPGLHLLLEGMFQLDAYVIFGVRPQNPETINDWFSVAFQANLGKAF